MDEVSLISNFSEPNIFCQTIKNFQIIFAYSTNCVNKYCNEISRSRRNLLIAIGYATAYCQGVTQWMLSELLHYDILGI